MSKLWSFIARCQTSPCFEPLADIMDRTANAEEVPCSKKSHTRKPAAPKKHEPRWVQRHAAFKDQHKLGDSELMGDDLVHFKKAAVNLGLTPRRS